MPMLQSGSRVGSYEIIAPIGAGGMGEVYRARDPKLKRDVAIKVLPGEWARDPERLARAQREAEVLASLNHPHIAQIYGHQEVAGSPCLVLEFVDGETLQERLKRGPLPLPEALEIAAQIADALDAAHERGIVHRDLKPANIKITPQGQVKVLDFGLAKTSEVMPVEELSHSPTLAGSATGAGVILGTSAYMSPEQAKGRSSDSRSDIWAFGVVLYEMLSGKPPFEGESVVEILGGVLRAEPDWTALPPYTRRIVRSLLRRCLQKDRAQRLRNIADARFQLEEALTEPAAGTTVTAPIRRSRERMWMAAAVIAATLVVAFAMWHVFSAPAEANETRLQVVTPPAINLTSFAISPDGRTLVFQATANGKAELYLRTLDSEKPRPLTGTDNATLPFWSPDSRSVGFFADGKLKRIDIGGGAPQIIADAPNSPSGTWNSEGVILFSLASTGPLQRVSSGGGPVTPVTTVDPPRQVSHRFPRFLPDGRHFLYFAVGTPEGRGVYVGSLDNNERKRLLDADSAAVFVPANLLVFTRQRTLFAQPFDVKRLETAGDPIPIADGLNSNLDWVAEPSFSVSNRGTIAYRLAKNENQLMWLDRSGRQTEAIGEPDTTVSQEMRLSPDARTLALARSLNGNFDLWLIELARKVLRRLTFNPADDNNPVWSPDGNRIAFSSRQKLGNHNIYMKPVNGTGSEEPLVESSENTFPQDWSSDGRFLLYLVDSAKTASDVWALSLADRKSFPIVQTNADEGNARFSSDGRWVVFTSNETGRYEVYVQPFPGPAAKSAPISTNGGINPQWRSDGKEIFYLGLDNRLMAVPVTLHTNAQVESGVPVALFALRPRSEYEASRDGERFLIHSLTEDASSSPITIVLNWAGRKK